MIQKMIQSVLILALLVLFSCSDEQEDVDKMQKLLEVGEQTMQHSTDYDVKIKVCNDMIILLQNFVKKHPEGEWSNTAQTALMSWESRRDIISREKESLTTELYSRLKARAKQEAKNAHPLSDIEGEVNLDKRDEWKQGSWIAVKDIYSIRMRGSILGTSIFKLKVVVQGHIATDTKQVSLDENAAVVE